MAQQEQLQKNASTTVTDTQNSSEFLQTRPFAAVTKSHTASGEQGTQANLQAKGDRASNFGHSFGNLMVSPPTSLVIQPKLTIGQPGDKYEQEADNVAAQVVQRINQPQAMSSKQGETVQRQEMPEEEELQMKPLANSIQRVEVDEEEIQMKPLAQQEVGIAASNTLESSIEQARGGGQAMTQSIRQPMEQAFGADFSSVKIHTDAKADVLSRSINAQAFTTKNDIFFKQGSYNSENRSGQELLAHELTHVVQQRGGNNIIHRKTMNIPEIPDEYVKKSRIFSNKTEDINKGINTYNGIKFSDNNYSKQIEVLEKTENTQLDWAKKHNNSISKNDIKKLKSDPLATLNVKVDDSDDPKRFEFMCNLINETHDELSAVMDQRDQDLASKSNNPQADDQKGGARGFVKGIYNKEKEITEKTSDLKDAKDGGKEVKEAGEEIYDGFKSLLTDFNHASQEAAKGAQEVFTGEISFMGIINQIKKALDYFGITDLISSIYNAYTSYKDMNALKGATQSAQQSGNQELAEATGYGYEKVWRRFWTSAVPKVVRGILKTASSILAFVTGGISLIVDLGQKVLGAVDTLYRKGKGFWKWLNGKKGVNRSKNASTIVNSAMSKDKTAIDLILKLDLFGMKDKVIMKVLDGTNFNEVPNSDLTETNRTKLLYLLTQIKQNNQLNDFTDKVSEKLKSFVG